MPPPAVKAGRVGVALRTWAVAGKVARLLVVVVGFCTGCMVVVDGICLSVSAASDVADVSLTYDGEVTACTFNLSVLQLSCP